MSSGLVEVYFGSCHARGLSSGLLFRVIVKVHTANIHQTSGDIRANKTVLSDNIT